MYFSLDHHQSTDCCLHLLACSEALKLSELFPLGADKKNTALMSQNKRRKNSMNPDKGLTDLEEELNRLRMEVEPVTLTSENMTPVIGYRPTYKAVLAKRGFLVRMNLGSGSYSKVKMALSLNKHPDKVAVKIVDRLKAPKDYQHKFMPRELELWPKLQHPNIVKLHEVFEDSHRVFMVLDYAEHGDALKYIQAVGAISEQLARSWTFQICDAVRYMHDQNIAHRDLKLENLLLDGDRNIKLSDFGFIRQMKPNHYSSTFCGSKSYAAPEILTGRPYNPKKSDVWAIGVILYIFVTGKMPFDETKGTKSIIVEQKGLNFGWPKTRRISNVCKALIAKTFIWDFNKRPDIHEILADSWFHAAASARVQEAAAEALARCELARPGQSGTGHTGYTGGSRRVPRRSLSDGDARAYRNEESEQ